MTRDAGSASATTKTWSICLAVRKCSRFLPILVASPKTLESLAAGIASPVMRKRILHQFVRPPFAVQNVQLRGRGESTEKLVKELQNPVASLVSVPNLLGRDGICLAIGLAFLVSFANSVRAEEAGIAPISGMQIEQPIGVAPQNATVTSPPVAPAGLLPIPDYSASFWKRQYLTGDWWGARTSLANKGVQIGVELNQTSRV